MGTSAGAGMRTWCARQPLGMPDGTLGGASFIYLFILFFFSYCAISVMIFFSTYVLLHRKVWFKYT